MCLYNLQTVRFLSLQVLTPNCFPSVRPIQFETDPHTPSFTSVSVALQEPRGHWSGEALMFRWILARAIASECVAVPLRI